MFPGIMIAIPLCIVFSRLGLLNSYAALILADSAISLPFAITILRPFFRAIPKELSEAAQIDGCNRFNAFCLVILPVAIPGVLTVGVFSFLTGWSDLLMSLSLVSDDWMRPVTAGLFKYMGNNIARWDMVMGFATLQMSPPLFLFVLAQRFVVSGLTDASIKL
jgi:multiple sugar transport system permease protein